MENKKKIIILLFISAAVILLFFIKEISFNDDLEDKNKGTIEDVSPGSWTLDEKIQQMVDRAKEIEYIKYDILSRRGGLEEFTLRIWRKNNKIRAEYINQLQTNTYFIDLEKEEYYYYRLGDRAAVILNKNEIEDVLKEDIIEKLISVIDNNYPIIIGEDRVDDKDCLVIQYNIEENIKGTMCIWKEHGLPISIEEGAVKKEVKEIETEEIEDNHLNLPPSIEKVDYFTY